MFFYFWSCRVIPPSQELNLRPAPCIGSRVSTTESPGKSFLELLELGLKEVLISSMTVLAKGANNTLQIDPIMKYDQPRKSPSFKGKWAVLTDDVSTVEQAGPSWAQGFTGGQRPDPVRAGSRSLQAAVTSGVALLCSGSEHRPFIHWSMTNSCFFFSYKLFQKYFQI